MSNPSRIFLALSMASQDGQDKYNGIMYYVKRKKLNWTIRIDRTSAIRPTIGEMVNFDGAIIDGSASLGMIRTYAATSLPLVALDWRHPDVGKGRRRLVRVDADNSAIGRLAATTLLQTAHFASFAFMPITSDIIWSKIRESAFVGELKRKRVSATVLSPSEPLDDQLRRLEKPAAVFTANDEMGDVITNHCLQAGIRVPDDLSVLGVDNEQLICRHTTPPLASVQPDFERAGYLAAAALHAMLCGSRRRTQQHYGVKGVCPRQSLGQSRSAGRLVQRALELIKDPNSTFEGVRGLALQLGVSRSLLDIRFRQILSKSVLDAILEAKLENVCDLLKNSNFPISEICAASRIGSGTHPQRAFRKHFGMSMSAYRKCHRENAPKR